MSFFNCFPNSDHQGAEAVVNCSSGLYLPFGLNILMLWMTAVTEVLWHATLCNVSGFLLITWSFCRGTIDAVEVMLWYNGSRSGTEACLCLVAKGTSDTRKHALQDAAVNEGVPCSFCFCWAAKSSCLLRCASRATHETPFLPSVPVSWGHQHLWMELFGLRRGWGDALLRRGQSGEEWFAASWVLVSLAVSVAFVLGVRHCEFGPVIHHPVNKDLIPSVHSKSRHIIIMFLPAPSARAPLEQLTVATEKPDRSVAVLLFYI